MVVTGCGKMHMVVTFGPEGRKFESSHRWPASPLGNSDVRRPRSENNVRLLYH